MYFLSSLCKNYSCILKHLISHCETFLPVDALLSCGQPEASAEKWKNLRLKNNVYIFSHISVLFVHYTAEALFTHQEEQG